MEEEKEVSDSVSAIAGMSVPLRVCHISQGSFHLQHVPRTYMQKKKKKKKSQLMAEDLKPNLFIFNNKTLHREEDSGWVINFTQLTFFMAC